MTVKLSLIFMIEMTSLCECALELEEINILISAHHCN